MGAGEAVTLAAFGVAGLLLAIAVWTDLTQRRIPNKVALGLGAVWLAWRAGLGAAALLLDGPSAAPVVLSAALDGAPFGLPTAGEGLWAAVLFGGGLLAFTLAYEALARSEAMGGGDVKLMAALALFLGPGRSAACLLVACVAALAAALVARARAIRRAATGASAAPGAAGEGLAAFLGGPASAGDQRRPASGALPFAPALAVGAVVALALGAGPLALA